MIVIKNLYALLWQNQTIKQTVFKNTFWLALAEGISRISKLVLIIYAARILGALEYGKFSFALAFVSLLVIFSDLGINLITTRELSQNSDKENEFGSILSLKLTLSFIAIIAMIAGSLLVTQDPLIRIIIWILAIYTVTNSFGYLIDAFFRARQRMEYEAWAKMIQAMLVVGLGIWILLYNPSAIGLGYAYLVASGITLLLLLIFMNFKIMPIHIVWDMSVWKKIIIMALPLAMAGIWGTVYNHIDSVMMGYWGQLIETGWYNAAYKITNVSLIPIILISQSFYPVLSVAFKQSTEKIQTIWNKLIRVTTFLIIPIAVGGIILGYKIINLIYGVKFAPASLAFQILITATIAMAISIILIQVLVVAHKQIYVFWVALLGAIVNIVLNFILIPHFSLYGAAISTLITYTIAVIILMILVNKHTPIKLLTFKSFMSIMASVIASFIMYLIITWSSVHGLMVVYQILIGTIIYLTMFLLIQKLTTYINLLYNQNYQD